jgi:hypothetical protein
MLVLLLALFAMTGQALAQGESTLAPPTQTLAMESPEAEIVAKRAELAKEITENKRQLEAAAASTDVETVQDLTAQRELLERIDRLYGQQVTALQRAKELTQEKQGIEAELAKQGVSGPAEPPPYTLTLLDGLRDTLDTHATPKETLQAAIQATEQALEQVRDLFKAREQVRRQARDAVETNKDLSIVASLQRRHRTSQLDSQAAAELVRLRELELKNEKLTAELQQQHETLLREKIALVQARLKLTTQDLEQPLAQIAEKEFALKAALDTAERELPTAERRWSAAQQRLDATPEPDPALVEEVEA